MTELTPMMKQYRRLKQKSGDAVLFFRLGDFYEMFEDDAREVSSLLNITLTKRNGIPMCGIPYHASHPYIARLLKAGKKIAVCEQISLPQGGKGIAEREIVEIVTPGTVLEEDILTGKENNFLASIGKYKDNVSFSYIDSSTGEFFTTLFSGRNTFEKLKEELVKINPSEVLIQESMLEDNDSLYRFLRNRQNLLLNRYPDWSFDLEESYEKLAAELGVTNLKGFGLEDSHPALFSAGVLLDYLHETNKSKLMHITNIRYYSEDQFLGMDESTVRNLEIFSNMQDSSSNYTLIEILDHTKTAMGGRLLKNWLSKPLIDKNRIEKRLNRVEAFYRDQMLLNRIRDALKGVLDTGRLSSRVAMEKAHAKDLLGLGISLFQCLEIIQLIEKWNSKEQFSLPDGQTVEEIESICSLITSAIDEDPPVILSEGNIIKNGYSSELDRLRELKHNSRQILQEYLETEKKKTGIPTLKIKYNKIIGHFFEVTKSNLSLVPEYFIRRQSLVSSERYTTKELGDLESELNNASEKIVELEKELFLIVRDEVRKKLITLQRTTDFLAEIDCLTSFAHAATLHGFSKPKITENRILHIEEGRHPVVEKHMPPGSFIPNGITLDPEQSTFVLLTGPNMAGKSTFLRQTALIALLAQSGSFIPAFEATIGIVDKIFCRVGASDNLSRGESTFLVEMNETSYILRTATERSLIIMDEVGRGTGTTDGLAIAWAVTEYILKKLRAKTLFATHFHQLSALRHPLIQQMYMDVVESEGEIVFLKKVKPGSARHSYGIQVAQLAGLPVAVVERAKELLYEISEEADEKTPRNKKDQKDQKELFSPLDILEKEIRAIDLNNTTPLQALERIEKWKKLL
jgi:DNA mismatch repair protein MutS